MKAVTLMANRIKAAHRWAVTGTPLGPHCLGDLHGLLQAMSCKLYRLALPQSSWHLEVMDAARPALPGRDLQNLLQAEFDDQLWERMLGFKHWRQVHMAVVDRAAFGSSPSC